MMPKTKRFITALLILVLLFSMDSSFGFTKLGNSFNKGFTNLSDSNKALAATKKKKVTKKNKTTKKKKVTQKKAATPTPAPTAKPTAAPTAAPTPVATVQTGATNPVIWADVPDVDVIRVGDYYYMVSTTMHLSPGVPVMRSTDLVNWEIVSYVYDTLANDDQRNLLNGKNMYGKGSWAAAIRYNNGTFYVCFASYDLGKTFIFQTKDIEKGAWTKSELAGVYHDCSLLFDDGHVYIVSGAGTIKIKELTADATAVKAGGVDQVLVSITTPGGGLNCEGSHIYKINGVYYLFLIQWPQSGTRRRIELCYKSDTLLGTYTGKTVCDDTMSYGNNGVAQGGIVETKDNKWYAMLFQDHGAVGRIPMLVPVTWTDGWPMMGENGKVPDTLSIGTKSESKIVTSDEFTYDKDKLMLQWQWNHNPDNSLWSVTKRAGYLRLTTGNVVPNILNARNTLSQRTEGPACTGETKLETTGMKAGDYAGISAFQNGYGMIGVKVGDDGKKYIICANNDGKGNPKEQASIPITQDTVYLKINFIFNTGSIRSLSNIDRAYFSYSLDGSTWVKLNYSLPMQYTLDHFMGYRIALYNYSTVQAGGYADFDYLHYTNK